VLCVQVLTTCSGKQWWCPNCKVGLCIEGCFSRYNTCLNYEEYNRHSFVLEGNGGFQCTCTMYIQCTVYCIMSDNLLKTFIVFFLLKSEVILTNFFAQSTVLPAPITSRAKYVGTNAL
jgi:hypothetical protein